MSTVSIDPGTKTLVVDGARVFPIVFSLPPPYDGQAPSGRPAYQELAQAGAGFVRLGHDDWSLASINGQIAAQRQRLDAAQAAGLHGWVWLGDVPNLPPSAPSPKHQLLDAIVNGLKDHPALALWKGIDEPRNPFRGDAWIRPAGMQRALQRIRQIDGKHPTVVIQAPRGALADLVPYRPTFDITGADIYPISYPPGTHAGTSNKDISVVGDITHKMAAAAGSKALWMTLQIAWSGVVPSPEHPGTVPRFPSLFQERFMVYQAIVNGARGIVFFGGHRIEIARPVDAQAGWNWTFFETVLRPLLRELTSTAVQPALLAPDSPVKITPSTQDIELITRQQGSFLYLIAVRRGGATTQVTFSGVPRKANGSAITSAEVLFEYAQDPPPPPPLPSEVAFRTVGVAAGKFRDWFAPHDVHVYRFQR